MSLHENDSLTETGVIDSIILIQLVDFLENKYKIEIPLEMLTPENFDTLDGINNSVMNTETGMSGSWLQWTRLYVRSAFWIQRRRGFPFT